LTDEQLVELAETAQAARVGTIHGIADLIEGLRVYALVIATVPALVEELRAARRRLAELEPAKVEW
jgi:hypothetical protein